MSRTGKGPRYRPVFHPAVADDIESLAACGPEVVAAARALGVARYITAGALRAFVRELEHERASQSDAEVA